ncbi:transmembrane and coiled-coil domains protein 1-like isoform X2 [Portunus trituberculatus]|uniref:transmembrane and coiled-coil domains protein 1-like isoform X2 n=1 Tax=Portunus trituberculatus TaxID=210409 RepID=UPI001E1CBC12|nr:transmembrane and coiled-coil domains protein 1-like isoform X2 [Portunus trituberculatus]
MLSVGGLPELAPPGAHRRSKSDCRLDKPDKVNDAVPLALSPRSLSPSAFNDHSQSRTRPSSPALMRSPSTSSIPEIFISGEDEHGSAMSPVTRLAVFSLADFLETVTLHPQSRRHQLHHHQQQQQQQRKKCGTGDVGGSGHGSGRRRSPLAARKSTPASGGPGGGEVSTATPAGNSVGGGGAGGAAGQAAPHQRTTSGGQTGRLSNAASHFDDTGVHSSTEDCDAETVPSSGVSNGSGELVDALRCVTDGGGGGAGLDDSEDQLPHLQRTREAVEHIQSKIQKTKDLIKEEQKARDENVNEYLKLAANADRQQMTRIKAVFEKKNQKSAALILQLQKKLENYQKRLREIETHGLNAAHRQPKEVLRDMGQGLKTVISKPKEIAHLIKNKFGSADNIKELAGEEDRDEERAHHGSATLPVGASLVPPTSSNTGAALPSHQQSTAGQGAGGSSSGGGHHGSKIGSEEGSECNSSITSESVPGGSTTLAHLTSPRNHHSQLTGVDYFGQAGGMSVEQLLMELRESREEIARLREEIDSTKLALAAELNGMREGLAEERFRCERLEEQVNDLTELHQNEMGNLVTNMTDMEEKVQYQSEERIRDLHEIVENCHTRISRMEHQQAQQQQQYLTLEGLENSNARAVFVKLINVLLTVLQVLLLVVATVANILTPLLQTRSRLIATITIVLLVVFVYIQLPELREIWLGAVERYRQLFSFV